MDADEDYQNRFTAKWLQHLEDASIDELVELRGVVGNALEARVKARQSELRAEADRLSAINGKTVLKAARRVKYQKGADIWSGTGSKPAWAAALGNDLEQYRV